MEHSEKNDAVLGYPTPLKIPASHWEGVARLEPKDVCRRAKVRIDDAYGYSVPFLNRRIIVDVKERCLRDPSTSGKLEDPLLMLVVLVYLQEAVELEPAEVLTAAAQLEEGHFFEGVHALDVGGVLEKLGHDLEAFAAAAKMLGGEPVPYADTAFRLPALPRVPLYYLLWAGDDEFPPNMTVCFDRTIERHLAADAIWGLVKRVSHALEEEASP